MEPDEKRIRELTTMLNLSLRLSAEEGYFLNVTSNDASFLNDARRLVKGDLPPTFNPSFSNGRSKRSRNA
jgi:hypothetical protein